MKEYTHFMKCNIDLKFHMKNIQLAMNLFIMFSKVQIYKFKFSSSQYFPCNN